MNTWIFISVLITISTIKRNFIYKYKKNQLKEFCVGSIFVDISNWTLDAQRPNYSLAVAMI